MLKSAIIRSSLHATGWAFRHTTFPVSRQFLWKRVCVPYLSWRDDEVICRTHSGQRFLVRPNDFVENRLCFFGIWEPRITALFRKMIGPRDVVLDVGANIGYYSSLASQLVGPSGQVFAVEASAMIRKRLEFNLKLNAATNVTVLPNAAWDGSGSATFHIASQNRGGSSLSEMSNREGGETVQLSRLDDLIPESVFPRIRLIKIDIEGAEHHALKGLVRVLESNRDCVIVCEIDPDNIDRLGGSAKGIFQLLKEYGYEAFQIGNSYSVEDYTQKNAESFSLTPVTEPPHGRSDVVFAAVSGQKRLLEETK